MQMLLQNWFTALHDFEWNTIVPKGLSADKRVDGFVELFLRR